LIVLVSNGNRNTNRSIKCDSSAPSFHITVPNTWRPASLQNHHIVTTWQKIKTTYAMYSPLLSYSV